MSFIYAPTAAAFDDASTANVAKVQLSLCNLILITGCEDVSGQTAADMPQVAIMYGAPEWCVILFVSLSSFCSFIQLQ